MGVRLGQIKIVSHVQTTAHRNTHNHKSKSPTNHNYNSIKNSSSSSQFHLQIHINSTSQSPPPPVYEPVLSSPSTLVITITAAQRVRLDPRRAHALCYAGPHDPRRHRITAVHFGTQSGVDLCPPPPLSPEAAPPPFSLNYVITPKFTGAASLLCCSCRNQLCPIRCCFTGDPNPSSQLHVLCCPCSHLSLSLSHGREETKNRERKKE
ncbi:hypothetical protein M0R45_015652 [Rubus argutus]|uniref:Uncharacterized protein n=1 Tax=Rubus argutus TaxID=59490 RepID=A0AAW1XPW0_RUBAR